MKEAKTRLFDYLITIVVWWFILFWIKTAILYSFYELMPHSYWFNYESITSQVSHYHYWERPRFYSDTHIFRDIDLTWNDTMYCDFNDWKKYQLYRSLEQEVWILHPLENSAEPWIFNIRWPNKEAKCYMNTVATLHLPYAIDKKQEVVSWPFYFIN